MNDSGPTNENRGVEDFFARQKDAQAAGDSEERKQWYVEEFHRREGETKGRTRPWRCMGTLIALRIVYSLGVAAGYAALLFAIFLGRSRSIPKKV